MKRNSLSCEDSDVYYHACYIMIPFIQYSFTLCTTIFYGARAGLKAKIAMPYILILELQTHEGNKVK